MVNNEGYLRSIPHVVLFAFVNHTIYKTNLCFLFILVTFVNYNFIITNLFTPLKMEENENLKVKLNDAIETVHSFTEIKNVAFENYDVKIDYHYTPAGSYRRSGSIEKNFQKYSR